MPTVRVRWTVEELNERLKNYGLKQNRQNSELLLQRYWYAYNDNITRDFAEASFKLDPEEYGFEKEG